MSWTVHKKGIPGKQSLVAVAVGDKVYTMSSSYTMSSYPLVDVPIEVRIFHTLYLRWLKFKFSPLMPAVPKRRNNHSAVLIGNVIYLWGGNPYCNVLYAFDVDTHGWFKPDVSGTPPEARAAHSACVFGEVMYIYGGRTHQWMMQTNSFYKLDTGTMVWSLIDTRGTPPLVSAVDHSATIIGTKMFVFGGNWGNLNQFNHGILGVFDTETNSWLSSPSIPSAQNPPGGLCHAPFDYKGELYIFGSHTRGQTLNNLWKFNPGTFSWEEVEPKGKGPCRISKVSCCRVGDRVILLGGNSHTSNHLFILDLGPSLKTLCNLAVIQYGLEKYRLPHNIRWELEAMTSNRKRKYADPPSTTSAT